MHARASADAPGADPGPRARRLARVLLGLLLVLLVLLAYGPGLGGGFVFDDFPNIVENQNLHVRGLSASEWLSAAFSSPASDLQRPLSMLSFAANHYFTGLDPWWMKLTGLAIHALNSLLLFALARRALRVARGDGQDATAGAWFVAAAWALNPINLMAVLYVVQRMEVLSHLFVFLGLLAYFAGRERQLSGRAGWGLVLAGLVPCTVLGMLAKESAALLPLYAFLAECCLFRFRGAGRGLARPLLLLFAVVLFVPAAGAVAWLLPRSMAPGAYASRDFGLVERLLTEPRVLLDYLRWTLAPDLRQLGLHHDDYLPSRGLLAPWTTLPSLLLLALLAAMGWMLRGRRPLFALGLLWFLGAHALTASFIPLELVFEHRNYFASAGVCLAVADLCFLLPASAPRRRLAMLAALTWLLLLGGLTHLRAREWNDPLRFVLSEAEKKPGSARATYDAARMLIVLSDYRADSPQARAAWPALERARRAPGSGILPDQAALMFAARTGAPLREDWWRDTYRKLRTDPIGPEEVSSIASLSKCAVAGNCVFPEAAMVELFDSALSRGEHPEITNLYAEYSWNVLHDRELALRQWRSAVGQWPDQPQYRLNLARALMVLGRDAEAMEQIGALRRLGRLGQNAASADALEAELRARRGAPPG